MIKLEGKIEFLGWWNRPWRLTTDDGKEFDLWTFFENLFQKLNNKPTSMKEEMESFTLFTDEKSDSDLIFEDRSDSCAVLLKNRERFGFSNLIAFLEDTFHRINGRKIIVKIEYQKISFAAVPMEGIFGLYFTEGNSCRIPEGKENKICKIGQGAETCIFTSISGRGFMCEKFNSYMARMLLDRLAKGNINARRVGNCALLGRKEEPKKLNQSSQTSTTP